MTDATWRTEALVIGSGPGGAVTACELAEGGREVLVVEDGPELPPDAGGQFTRAEMETRYRGGGVTPAFGAPPVAYVEARCVGGGSEINSGLYHRTPASVLDAWQREFAIDTFDADTLAPHFAACERALSVSSLPGAAPPASLRLAAGAEALGWHALEVPRWYRYDRDGRGERQTMSRTFVPRLRAAGARLEADTRVVRLARRGDGWRAQARQRTAGGDRAVTIDAARVFVCAGAIQTPALLRRSGIAPLAGRRLGMHPTVKLIAAFPDVVNSPGMGVPVHQVKEFAPRYSFGCAVSSPPHLAVAMLDHPDDAARVLAAWPHHAVYYAMTGGGAGSVRPLPGFADPLVRYALAPADLAELGQALHDLARCLFAAGATRLYPTVRGGPVLSDPTELDRLPAVLPRGRTSLMTIHLFASCPMGENRARCVTDSWGRVHGAPGVHVGDASVLCGPPGVNPQGTVMALARRNARMALGLD